MRMPRRRKRRNGRLRCWSGGGSEPAAGSAPTLCGAHNPCAPEIALSGQQGGYSLIGLSIYVPKTSGASGVRADGVAISTRVGHSWWRRTGGRVSADWWVCVGWQFPTRASRNRCGPAASERNRRRGDFGWRCLARGSRVPGLRPFTWGNRRGVAPRQSAAPAVQRSGRIVPVYRGRRSCVADSANILGWVPKYSSGQPDSGGRSLVADRGPVEAVPPESCRRQRRGRQLQWALTRPSSFRSKSCATLTSGCTRQRLAGRWPVPALAATVTPEVRPLGTSSTGAPVAFQP